MEKTFKYFSLGKGGKSIIKLNDITLTISRPGIISKLCLGFTGEKTILLSQISSVQIKKVGLSGGYIQFILAGSHEVKSGIIAGSVNENIIYSDGFFPKTNKKINESFEELKKSIELTNSNKNNNNTQLSKYDELKKLKDLYDNNVLTEDEFLSEKQKLLNID